MSNINIIAIPEVDALDNDGSYHSPEEYKLALDAFHLRESKERCRKIESFNRERAHEGRREHERMRERMREYNVIEYTPYPQVHIVDPLQGRRTPNELKKRRRILNGLEKGRIYHPPKLVEYNITPEEAHHHLLIAQTNGMCTSNTWLHYAFRYADLCPDHECDFIRYLV